MKQNLAEKVLFEGEADEYALIIKDYPICHNDCMEILKAAALLKGSGFSNKLILDRLLNRVRR